MQKLRFLALAALAIAATLAGQSFRACEDGSYCLGDDCVEVDGVEGPRVNSSGSACKRLPDYLAPPRCSICDLSNLKIIPKEKLVATCGSTGWKYCPPLLPTGCGLDIINADAAEQLLLAQRPQNRSWIALFGDSLMKQVFHGYVRQLTNGTQDFPDVLPGNLRWPAAYVCCHAGHNCTTHVMWNEPGNVTATKLATAVNEILDHDGWYCVSHQVFNFPNEELLETVGVAVQQRHKPTAVLLNPGVWMLFKKHFNFLGMVKQMETLADMCLRMGREHGVKCVLQGITRPIHRYDEANGYGHYRIPPFLHAYSAAAREIWIERQRRIDTMPFIDTYSLTSHPKLMLSIGRDHLHYYANHVYPQILVQLHYAAIFKKLCSD